MTFAFAAVFCIDISAKQMAQPEQQEVNGILMPCKHYHEDRFVFKIEPL